MNCFGPPEVGNACHPTSSDDHGHRGDGGSAVRWTCSSPRWMQQVAIDPVHPFLTEKNIIDDENHRRANHALRGPCGLRRDGVNLPGIRRFLRN